MNTKDFDKMTDEELLAEKKNMKNAKMLHALFIGFLFGVLTFGLVSWGLSASKHIGFLVPMLIPVIFLYKLLTKPNRNRELEALLKKRGLG